MKNFDEDLPRRSKQPEKGRKAQKFRNKIKDIETKDRTELDESVIDEFDSFVKMFRRAA